MKRAKILLIIAPLLALGLAFGVTGTAMACPDGPTQIGPDGGIVAPSSGDTGGTTIIEEGTPPATVSQASTSTASFVIPVVASMSCLGLAVAAFALRKRIRGRASPSAGALLAHPVEGL